MKLSFITIIFLGFIAIFPQSYYSPLGYINIININQQGVITDQLNSMGTSAILNNVDNIGSMNPASIWYLHSFSAGLSYQFHSNIYENPPSSGIISRAYNYVPQSFGATYHFNEFSFGLGYGQKYNFNYELNEFISYTSQSWKYKQMLQYYSLITAYTVKNIFDANSELTFGFKYIYNHHFEDKTISNIPLEGTFKGNRFEGGFHFRYNLDKERNINFGFSYMNKLEMQSTMHYKDSTIIKQNPRIKFIEPQIEFMFPAQFNIDLTFKSSAKLILVGSCKIINMAEIESDIINQPDLSFSGIYLFGKDLSASLGVFDENRKYKHGDLETEMDAFFITAGITLKIEMVNIDIALADSHLGSDKNLKQIIGKIGTGIGL